MELRILSFESSSNWVSVALLEARVIVSQARDETFMHTKSEESRQTAQTLLLPTIDRLLKAQGWEKDTIDCIVVGIGPGSFTGMRTAVVTARTLAQALELPLVGVSIFDCYARWIEEKYITNQPIEMLKYGIVLPAGKENYLISCYPYEESSPGPLFLHKEQLNLGLNQVELWFANSQAKDELAKDHKNIEELPVLENVAATQAQIAHDRLSLSRSLKSREFVSIDQKSPFRSILLEEFPFERVKPLYVRGASVTVKEQP